MNMVDLNAAKQTAGPTPEDFGRRVVQSTTALASGLPKIGTQQNSPWFYKFKQSCWMWHDERERWYIDLRYLPLMPGVGGYSNDKNSWENAVMETRKKGWQEIMWTDRRLPQQYQNYCSEYPLKSGGKTYVSIFHAPDVLDDENEWQRDDEAYFAFLDALIECGIVQPRTERMCRKAINRAKSAVSRLTQDLKANPGHKQIEGRFVVATKRLAKMLGDDAEMAELEADEVVQATRADAKREDS